MITLGIGCAMLARLYNVAAMLAELRTRSEFNVGVLGIIGSFMFLFTANFGQIDSLTDDGSKELRKFRNISLLAPAACLALYSPVFFAEASLETKIVCFLVVLFAMGASYFHLKHLIIPDVNYGVVRCIRGYNLIALIYCFANVFEFTAKVCDWVIPLHFAYLVIVLCIITVFPVLRKGVDSWMK